MSLNRLFAVFVVLSLLLVAGLTIRMAIATSALDSPEPAYEVQYIGAQRDSLNAVDRSYDEVEHIRSQQDWLNSAGTTLH